MTRSILAAVIVFAGSVGCASGPRPITENPSATVTLRSALVASPKVTLSCVGGAFCRENTFDRDDADALEEAREDCDRRRGRATETACPAERAIVTCAGDRMKVVTYVHPDRKEQEESVTAVVDACEALGGTLEPGPASREAVIRRADGPGLP
jgi:hypothetical protein